MKENPQRPLVLHTLPSVKEPIPKKDPKAQLETASIPEPMLIDGTLDEGPNKKKRKIAKPTATIPRLVSVVEIIKREYGVWASTRETDGGPLDDSLRLGLHQYNELATLEDLGLMEAQDHATDDVEQLRWALQGKNLCVSRFLIFLAR